MFVGMASSGSILRPSCANREDMLNKWKEETLDKMKDKDLKTPPCWCGDVCKVKVSTDRKKSWTKGRRYFMCPNHACDRRNPCNAYDLPRHPLLRASISHG
uniref:Uncharacterized protein n=1 Tax=Hordeum vulgare subsp. vulgare TaxID=112509 RepID=A0A8I6W5P4_HORVV